MLYIRGKKGLWNIEFHYMNRRYRKATGTSCKEEAQKIHDQYKKDVVLQTRGLMNLEVFGSSFIDANGLYSKGAILDQARPYRLITGVYFLIRKAEIVYVGKSTNVSSRIGAHSRLGKDFDSFSIIEIDLEYLDFEEERYIKKFRPILNIKKNPALEGKSYAG